MTRSTLSEIALAETYSQKIHLGWKYCQEVGVQYNPVDSISKHPEQVADMIWAHGRYGKRTEAVKKLDAIHVVCAYLSLHGSNAA